MGIMQTETIIATLLAAAAFLKRPVQDLVTQSIKDAYDAAKAYLRAKLLPNLEAVDALEMATEKPESLVRRARLLDAAASANLCRDEELARLMRQLAGLVPASLPFTTQVEVTGRGNRVQVAGRDLINTTKYVQRAAITPDERHLSAEQREQLRSVIGELADRLAGDDGRPNFAGAHRMLQRRFGVPSYLLLAREQFADALAFLKQHRAMHRSRLKNRNPVAYRNDYFRAIFAGARELGWPGEQVYQFATETLRLDRPATSLKQFGPVQLKTVAEAMQRQLRQARQKSADPIFKSGGADAPQPVAGAVSGDATSEGGPGAAVDR